MLLGSFGAIVYEGETAKVSVEPMENQHFLIPDHFFFFLEKLSGRAPGLGIEQSRTDIHNMRSVVISFLHGSSPSRISGLVFWRHILGMMRFAHDCFPLVRCIGGDLSVVPYM